MSANVVHSAPDRGDEIEVRSRDLSNAPLASKDFFCQYDDNHITLIPDVFEKHREIP